MLPLSDPDLRRRTFPYVTITIIAINVLVFIYELSLNDRDTQLFFFRWGLIPQELTSGMDVSGLRDVTTGRAYDVSSPIPVLPVWGTVFTSMFLHGGWLHILGNMLYLWVFGDNVEDRLGHVKFLLFYLGAGLAAAMTQVAINQDSQTPMIGASGAIAGVLGGYLVLYPFSRVNTLLLFVFITVVQVPAVLLLGFWFILQLFQGTGSLGGGDLGGVAYWAHIGGFAFGLLILAAYKLGNREPLWPRGPHRPWGFSR